jgi:GntR family transcriptional regulator, vanillate catabolism transcriptional regulator
MVHSESGDATEFVSQTGRTFLAVRKMLLGGDLKPGTRVSELSMVSRLGVSRTPIRLALDRLGREGLLETCPSGGFVVRSFSPCDVLDAMETRGVLEGTAARLAAERFTHDRELHGLRRSVSEIDAYLEVAPALGSFERYQDLNDAFHSAVLDLANSPMLRRTMERVMALPFARPSALVEARTKFPRAAEMFAIGQEHHRIILDAISRRQGGRAEAAAREHSRLSRRIFESILEDHSALDRVPWGLLIRLPNMV